ncbi:hypothetical protein B0H15DRAFT_771569 [Mycena belliarum]|uniref:Uncharacterized protein n=1 Tax=Mycena belliarum TaxID=1033014 RepID=A0AAD6XX77_9AGAR|nr:hypothetical protein B0H15DRAFT_771569 [Mycena belliae]
MLNTILYNPFPIPIYLSWGQLPREISPFDVPKYFQGLAPNPKELKFLATSHGQVKFSQWAVDSEAQKWCPNPYTPVSPPEARIFPLPLPSNNDPTTSHRDPTPTVERAPFPPLPAHSKQKQNETIQEFFTRRRERNVKRMASESAVDLQRRTQRADHAKRGEVPSKACVFVWEEQDGHYIRQPGGRGNYAELWREYPRSQRRFDPVSNEWDLCELFRNNDPVFGEGPNPVRSGKQDDDDEYDDDDDDTMADYPAFTRPMDLDMLSASQLPQMPVVQTQPPHDLDDDVPADEDLGLDLTEADVPERDLAAASKKCVNRVYLKFGFAPPRTDEPKYESSGENLLKALEMRFGFALPRSPETFVPRDPPPALLKPELLANVIATDVLEVLRQPWGPELRNVASHLLARGIPFWLAYISAEIMPAREPADTTSGLGYRPDKYKFDVHDYNAYTTQRDIQLLHTPRGRIALQYGGIIGRLARSEVADDDFFRGFNDDIYGAGDCLWDGTSPSAYWYDRLSDHEIDTLCGVYHIGTGM